MRKFSYIFGYITYHKVSLDKGFYTHKHNHLTHDMSTGTQHANAGISSATITPVKAARPGMKPSPSASSGGKTAGGSAASASSPSASSASASPSKDIPGGMIPATVVWVFGALMFASSESKTNEVTGAVKVRGVVDIMTPQGDALSAKFWDNNDRKGKEGSVAKSTGNLAVIDYVLDTAEKNEGKEYIICFPLKVIKTMPPVISCELVDPGINPVSGVPYPVTYRKVISYHISHHISPIYPKISYPEIYTHLIPHLGPRYHDAIARQGSQEQEIRALQQQGQTPHAQRNEVHLQSRLQLEV